jgi:hypothetical protein
MKTSRSLLLVSTLLVAAPLAALAQAVSAAVQPKIDAQIKEIATWAAEPALVAAVRAHNASVPADHAALNQDKWRTLTVLDPLVRSFSKNEVGVFLKTKKSELVSEAFVSDAQGLKVGFIAKTTNWSHAGKPKHDVPMTGKTWQGTVEVDESTGQQQVQVSVPVLDGGKPIGSLVVGLSLAKLTP